MIYSDGGGGSESGDGLTGGGGGVSERGGFESLFVGFGVSEGEGLGVGLSVGLGEGVGFGLGVGVGTFGPKTIFETDCLGTFVGGGVSDEFAPKIDSSLSVFSFLVSSTFRLAKK